MHLDWSQEDVQTSESAPERTFISPLLLRKCTWTIFFNFLLAFDFSVTARCDHLLNTLFADSLHPAHI